MEKVLSNFDFSTIEKLMGCMHEIHTPSNLSLLKNELNKFFYKAKCKEILYTNNTDKLLFGMRVYPVISAEYVHKFMGDDKTEAFDSYYLEFDSKLFDPMLGLNKKELTAILLHEIGHIVYDTSTIDEVRANIDMYYTYSNDYADINPTYSYKNILAYALKDSVVKAGSLFAKLGNTEVIADAFVVSCGYGPYLESAIRKITSSMSFITEGIDNRFIVLAWALRLHNEFNLKRLPAIRTLNKAKTLTGSKLEQREITYVLSYLNRSDDLVSESFISDIKNKFSKKFAKFKFRGINSIKDDIYELNLRVRTAESTEDLMYIIRQTNTNISILQDYLNEDISDAERKSVNDALQELYSIRQKAAKEQKVRDRYDSAIQVFYPDMTSYEYQ